MNKWRPFYVAGVQFHELGKVIDRLTAESMLNLVEEHDNKYDPYAVAIYFDHVQVGYVPKSMSAEISNALYDYFLECKVIKINKEAKPWNRLLVEIVEVEG